MRDRSETGRFHQCRKYGGRGEERENKSTMQESRGWVGRWVVQSLGSRRQDGPGAAYLRKIGKAVVEQALVRTGMMFDVADGASGGGHGARKHLLPRLNLLRAHPNQDLVCARSLVGGQVFGVGGVASPWSGSRPIRLWSLDLAGAAGDSVRPYGAKLKAD